jgi:hypothetical protein
VARITLGIVLLLITTSGCAGQPWRSRRANDLAAVLTQDVGGPPVTIRSAPGFYQPIGDSALRSQASLQKPSTQSVPDSSLYNQNLTGRVTPGERLLHGARSGQQNDTSYISTYLGSTFTPYFGGSQAAIPPDMQQHIFQSAFEEFQRIAAEQTASSNEKFDTKVVRDAAFTDTDGTPGSIAATQKPDPVPLRNRYDIEPTDTSKVFDVRAEQSREVATQMISTINTDLIRNNLSASKRTRLNVMERFLHAFLGDTESALAPIKGLDEDEQEFWKYFAHCYMISLDANEENTSSRRSALALRKLRVAGDHLANMSRLDVRNLAFCSKVHSYGRFDEFKSYGFKPGQEVLLYVEIDNFAVESKSNRYETELQGEYTIFDVDRRHVTSAGLPLDKQFSMNRRHDYFIAYRVYMPKDIKRGHYLMQLTIEDLKGNKSNHATLEFWIR